jgi:mannose-1-phosphate guanylyltransferase
MIKAHRYCVVLAGGGGTRLWPLSRADKPKQFLKLPTGATLLEHTLTRMKSIVAPDALWVSTTQAYASQVAEYCVQTRGTLVVEPDARNTGPAIALSCLQVCDHDPDAVVMFMPADHYIPAPHDFLCACESALSYAAQHEQIVLFGLKPQYPATGYGYIEYACESTYHQQPCRVVRFHEKPSSEVAQWYCQQNTMLWNIGMVCARAHVFLQEFQRQAPDVYAAVVEYHDRNAGYERARAVSFDHLILERSDNTVVFPVSFEWLDIGTLEPFLSLGAEPGFTPARVVSIDSKDNVVHVGDTLVALVGVENLCVVQAGNTLLIIQRDQMQKVTRVVQRLKQAGANEFL